MGQQPEQEKKHTYISTEHIITWKYKDWQQPNRNCGGRYKLNTIKTRREEWATLTTIHVGAGKFVGSFSLQAFHSMQENYPCAMIHSYSATSSINQIPRTAEQVSYITIGSDHKREGGEGRGATGKKRPTYRSSTHRTDSLVCTKEQVKSSLGGEARRVAEVSKRRSTDVEKQRLSGGESMNLT